MTPQDAFKPLKQPMPLMPLEAPARAPRSKALAAWLALLGGAFGLHRLYLKGWADPWAWLHWPPTLLGLWGLNRMLDLGQDDQLAWALIPMLGLTLSWGALHAILFGLMPDLKWAEREPGAAATTWSPILAAALALFLGGMVLTGTIAYGGQKFFEWQLAPGPAQSTPTPTPTPG